MIDTIGIPLAYVIVAALTLWIVIGSRGHWIMKVIAIIGSVLFSVSLWHSLVSLQGWPTAETLPEKFEIKWIDVKEANKKTGFEGAIYVWVKDISPEADADTANIPILHSKGKSNDSRLHIMPYSRELHKQAEGIKKQIASGKRYFGEMKKGKGGIKGDGKGDGKGKGKGNGKMSGKMKGEGTGKGEGDLSNQQDFIFHELPPAVIPQKVTN